MTSERIEGEFHYAEFAPTYDPPSWLVKRTSDDEAVFACPDQGWAWKEVKNRDVQAKHFYAQALADVDAAAEKLDSFNAWAFYDEDEKLEAWDVNGVTAPTLTQAILSTGGE